MARLMKRYYCRDGIFDYKEATGRPRLKGTKPPGARVHCCVDLRDEDCVGSIREPGKETRCRDRARLLKSGKACARLFMSLGVERQC